MIYTTLCLHCAARRSDIVSHALPASVAVASLEKSERRTDRPIFYGQMSVFGEVAATGLVAPDHAKKFDCSRHCRAEPVDIACVNFFCIRSK